MKKLLLLFTTLMTLSSIGQTSVYHPFPDSNVVWNFHYYLNCFMGLGNEYYSITISEDTLINSISYHKLTTPFIKSFSTGTCEDISSGYKGAIRQDTALKKVFYVPPTDITEQLLYDFNMQIGDTIKGFLENNAFSPDTVISIDSVLVGANYRKRWNINNCYGIRFIEGIGSTYGLIQQSPGCITDQADYTITCFQQNGKVIYPDTTSNCDIITNIKILTESLIQINIFPNPSNSSFTIDIDKATNIRETRLTDLLGNIILQQQTCSQSKIIIDNLQSGTYILTLIDKENRKINRKIISSP